LLLLTGSSDSNDRAEQNQQKKRPYYGGGMPKGHKTRKTLEKEAAREALCQRVFANLTVLVEAQIASALGLKVLVVRNKQTGRIRRVTATTAALELGRDEESIEVWTKDPSTRAFADLMNRAIGKPVSCVDVNQSGSMEIRWREDLMARLDEGRKRVARLDADRLHALKR
jgi:hypothetical protein